MSLFSTSGDILRISLSIAVIAIAFFLCWLLYYLAMSLHQLYKISKDARQIADDLGSAIKAFKEKLEGSMSYLLILGEGVKTLLEILKEKDLIGKEKKEKKNE